MSRPFILMCICVQYLFFFFFFLVEVGLPRARFLFEDEGDLI